ncbi:hypothetical protein VNO77_23052 [Canavalia gladiata]|uniref:Uncharacterized protein n=1 Tax=Canavalia gladiata TaxID=3824 RepID=A0AAN9L3S5_CANGL
MTLLDSTRLGWTRPDSTLLIAVRRNCAQLGFQLDYTSVDSARLSSTGLVTIGVDQHKFSRHDASSPDSARLDPTRLDSTGSTPLIGVQCNSTHLLIQPTWEEEDGPSWR